MLRWKNVWSTTAAVAAAMAMAAPAYAQQITSNVRGTVTDADGAPVVGAEVAVTDLRTNFTTNTSTASGGSFALSGLETGGPYSVTISAPGFQSQRLENLQLSLGDTTNFAITLESAEGAEEEIVVIAARDRSTRVAIGPNVVFDQETVEAAPTITRDIRDVLRFDPRLVVSANANGTQQNVSCLGGNNRSNVFTIDGVQQGDQFGLNASAFQNRFGNPYPFNATRQVSVEYAPFDVQYANFSGCNINVVTRSGSNEFHGSGFGEYSSDGLTGAQQADNLPDVVRPLARNYRWGADFSGALIKDRVFFYVGYEEQDLGASSFINFGPINSGVGTPQPFITLAQVEDIRARIQQVYGFDPGGIISETGFDSRKILTRWDFVLSDKHKLAFTYNRFREAQVQPDDGPSQQVFAFGGNFQTQGTRSQSYSARLFSQWNNRLSTELRFSRSDVQDVQDPLGGGEAQSGDPQPRIVIGVTGSAALGTSGTGVLIAGPGFSRAANDLRSQNDQVRALLKYNTNKHNYTIGFDWNDLSVFNLFVQNATGTLNFSSLTNFNNNILNPPPLTATSTLGISTSTPNGTNATDGTLAGVFGNGRGSDDITGAAASWSRTIFSGYFQDKWSPIENLTVTYGVRYDRYGGEAPPLNAAFTQRYGFTNSQTFQSLDLVQPRLAVQWDIPESLFGFSSITFGAAVFGGGDPAVFFSNAFSNTGANFVTAQSGGPSNGQVTCTAAQLATTFSNGQFVGLPACITNAQDAGLALAAGPVNAIDPEIDPPSVVRANFEFKHTTDFGGAVNGLFDDWNLTLSYIHSAFRNGLRFFPLAQEVVQQTAIGFPRLQTVDPLNAGCNLQFGGTDNFFAGTFTTACNGLASRNGDILLTNTRNGTGNSDAFAFIAQRNYEYALGPIPTTTNLTLGYAFTNGRDAFSNNGNTTATGSLANTVVTGTYGEFPVGPGNFFNPHNITLTLNQQFEFLKGYKTTLFGFLQARSGNRFSYTSQGGNFVPGIGGNAFYSLYVPSSPLATGDPNVTYSTAFLNNAITTPGPYLGLTGLQALNQFIESEGLERFRGQLLPRNAFQDDWFFDLDLRFEQEIPTPLKGFRLEAYSTINNFLNLIGREGNIQRGFGDTVSVVGLGNLPGLTNANVGQTVPVQYTSFQAQNLNQIINLPSSLWQVNFGLKFSF